MATQARSAAQRIDWAGVASKLRPETASAINAFRRRHQELAKAVADLKEANTTINFEQYRKVLKNTKVITEAERALKSFTPATVDLSSQLRIIEEQEKKAITAAEATRQQVAGELGELQAMLKNIETARPVDQLTVEDVCKAVPNQEIERTVIKMAKRGQWVVPGYYEKFGEFVVGF